MVKISYKIHGLEELQRAIAKRPYMMATQAKAIVERNATQLKRQTMRNMTEAYTGHKEGSRFVKPTGATKGSVNITYQQAGMTAIVAPHTEYFAYLEYGTRFMAARPTLKPAWVMQRVKFANDLKKMMR